MVQSCKNKDKEKKSSDKICIACESPITDDIFRTHHFTNLNGDSIEVGCHYFPPCSNTALKNHVLITSALSMSEKFTQKNTILTGQSTVIDNSISNSLNDDKDVLFEKSISFIKSGIYEEALGCINEILELDPANIKILFYMGFTLNRLGRFEEAASYFDKVLAIQPHNLDVLLYKGTSF